MYNSYIHNQYVNEWEVGPPLFRLSILSFEVSRHPSIKNTTLLKHSPGLRITEVTQLISLRSCTRGLGVSYQTSAVGLPPPAEKDAFGYLLSDHFGKNET